MVLRKSKSKGQSLVELALVMPLLVFIIAGLAELGWYAANYLTLQEVARQVARSATTLYGDYDPRTWEIEDEDYLSGSLLVPNGDSFQTIWLAKYRNCRATDPSSHFGFYNTLGCIGLQSFDPLDITGFEPGNSTTDDIIISGFTIVPDGKKMKVSNRYPTNAAECVRDDFRRSLGFSWGGNHINSQGCIGSEFTNAEVEDMFNADEFAIETYDRSLLQPQGVVLVEIHWKHTTLTQFAGLSPAVSPVLAALGVSPVISVWAAFPLPQVERGLPEDQGFLILERIMNYFDMVSANV